MNSLSLLIYFAEVIPRLSHTVWVVSVLSFIGFLGYATFGSMFNENIYYANSHEEKERKASWFREKKYLPPTWFVVAILGAWILVSFSPSKQTIYLIAASEASEAVVTSDVGKQMLADIQEILQHQLNQFKPRVGQ